MALQMKRLLIAAVLLLGFASPGAATFYTGNQLLEDCTSRSVSKRNVCSGYVMAIADAMEENRINGWRTCRPTGMMSLQLRDVVIRHLRKSPQHRHHTASSLVAEAFQKAWPCKK